MGIGSLKKLDPKCHELLTEILDEDRWRKSIRTIASFMNAKGIQKVRAKYGFVLDRHLDGLEQEKDQIVNTQEIDQLVSDGLKKGTIEFKGPSDFVFHDEDGRILVMLCNDGDIHVASKDTNLILELGRKIKANGVAVYDAGKPI